MQKDWNLREDIELSLWYSWQEPGIGVTTLLCDPAWMIKIECLCFGIALTLWRIQK